MSRTQFPESGTHRDLVMQRLRELKARDTDWRGGRASMFMFKANDEVSRVRSGCIRRVFQ